MSRDVSNTVEYGEGYSAFENKRGKESCPYRIGSQSYRRWLVGYEEARDDAQESTSLPQVEEPIDNEILQAAVEETKYV